MSKNVDDQLKVIKRYVDDVNVPLYFKQMIPSKGHTIIAEVYVKNETTPLATVDIGTNVAGEAGDEIRVFCDFSSILSGTDYYLKIRTAESGVLAKAALHLFNKDAFTFGDGQTGVGGTVPTYLNDLGDVTLASVQDRDFLIYNNANSRWENDTIVFGDLSAVTIDEDNMASDSASHVPTQQSVKAYVDGLIGNSLAQVLAVGNTSGGTNLVMTAGDVITADTINETTTDVGVTIEQVLLKDNVVTADQVNVNNLRLDGNTISSTDTNGDVILAPDGTGVSTTAKRITSTFLGTNSNITDFALYLASNDGAGIGLLNTTSSNTDGWIISTNSTGELVFRAGTTSSYGTVRQEFLHTGGTRQSAQIEFLEQSAPIGPTAGYGQLWVKNTSPNQLWFQDDEGFDYQLGVNQFSITNEADNRVITSTGVDSGNAEANLTFDGTTLTVVGKIDVDNVRIDGNTVSTTDTNGNLLFVPDGTGVSRFTNAAEFADGTVSAPGIAFASATDCGMYINTGNVSFAHGGAEKFRLSANGLELITGGMRNSTGGIIFSEAGIPNNGFEPPGTSATVADGDLVMVWDIDDSNNVKQVTALDIANLAGGGGYSHPNHTGEVTSVGDGATTLTVSAITNKTALTTGLAGTDELLVSDAGVIKRMDVSVMNDYFNANLNFNNYSHPNHTGEVTSTGDGATVVDVTAITAKTALTSGLAGTDELLVNDGGTIKRMDVSVMNAYFDANLSFYSVTNEANDRVITSTGAGAGNAEANLTFDGTTLTVVGEIDVDNLLLNGNTISSTNTNGDIILDPNGTGSILLQGEGGGSVVAGDGARAKSNNMVVFGLSAGTTSSATIGASSIVIGNSAGAGTDDIGANTVLIGQSTVASDIYGIAIGTSARVSAARAGMINLDNATKINSLANSLEIGIDGSTAFKVGTTYGTGMWSATSNPANAVDGCIYYKSDTDEFRGRVNGSWKQLLTEDDTFPVASEANNRVLTSDGAGGAVAEANMTFDGSNLDITGRIDVDNLRLNGNIISSQNTNGDIELDPNGSGDIILDIGSTGIVRTSSTHTSNISGSNDVITKGYADSNYTLGTASDFVQNAGNTGSFTELKTKVIEIGDWNMDTASIKTVAHGLTYANIRYAFVTVRNDGDTSISMGPNAGQEENIGVTCSATNVAMTRLTGGVYDNSNYNSTSYNRGWVTLFYEDLAT